MALTSYWMVRLVFCPCTQLWSTICTSELLRTSTRVSSGFVLLGHRSPVLRQLHWLPVR